MNEIQSRWQTLPSRIEAVTDPEVNKELFTLYHNLIAPLTNIEKTAAEISTANRTIAECSGTVTYSLADTFTDALLKIPKTFVIMTVCLSIFYGTVINWLIEDSGFNIPGILEPVLDPGITESLICFAVLSTILCLFTEFKHTISAVNSENKNRKKAYESAVASLSRLEPDLKQQIFRIRDVIQFVPEKYRSSDALKYFVDSYCNSRVDNLKEAVNAYDTHLFRSLTEDAQQQILGQLEQNNDLLRDIRYQQLVTAQQLESIQGDIWLSSIF